jgi:hypothetical protein
MYYKNWKTKVFDEIDEALNLPNNLDDDLTQITQLPTR